jgi:hypothetical protein
MTDRFVLSPRLVYDPTEDFSASGLALPTAPVASGPITRLRAIVAAFVTFYRDPLAWLALVLNSVVLCYLGGMVMFWFHAIQLGEGGPAISWYAHWMLDSTFGFIALTPALAVIMPIAVWAAQALAETRKMIPWLYAAVAGGLFALVTAPGPIAHNLLVGRGTWIANEVTHLVGNPSQPLTPVQKYPALAEMTQQLGAGLPLYLSLVALTALAMRRMIARGWQQAREPVLDGGAPLRDA